MTRTDVVAFRGDTITLTVEVSRQEEPLDISGCLVRFTAKYGVTDPNAAAVIVKSTVSPPGGVELIDAPNGVAEVTIDPADTALLPLTAITRLVYDVELTEVDGRVSTVNHGTLSIVPDVGQ